jgi:hypothetical protein
MDDPVTQITSDGERIPYPIRRAEDRCPVRQLQQTDSVIPQLQRQRRLWEALTLPFDGPWYYALYRVVEGCIWLGLDEETTAAVWIGSTNCIAFNEKEDLHWHLATLHKHYVRFAAKQTTRVTVNGETAVGQPPFWEWLWEQKDRTGPVQHIVRDAFEGLDVYREDVCCHTDDGDVFREHWESAHGHNRTVTALVREWRISEHGADRSPSIISTEPSS